MISSLVPLLPAGRKFCKITQNGRKKKVISRENWRPYGRRFWTKAAENRPKKIISEKPGFLHKIFALFKQLL
jgi:hypothetical protein